LIESVDDLAEEISRYFESKDEARERALKLNRLVIRKCGAAIRSVHREEFEKAKDLMNEAGSFLEEIRTLLSAHPDVRHAGFVTNAEQEYAEARVVYSIITQHKTPAPDEVGVEMIGYLGGLGDTTGELRRHILDLIRKGKPEEGEPYLEAMEEIYHLLMLFDYPDAITGGLRRKSDMARSLLERTRGDLTNAIGQRKLEVQLKLLEAQRQSINANER